MLPRVIVARSIRFLLRPQQQMHPVNMVSVIVLPPCNIRGLVGDIVIVYFPMNRGRDTSDLCLISAYRPVGSFNDRSPRI